MPVNGQPHWEQDPTSFRLYDGSSNNYGAPSGAGVTVELSAVTGNAFFRGTVTASQIQGPAGGAGGTGARMWLDFTAGDPQFAPAGATPGVSPYMAAADDKGVTRVESGYLAALGVSPVQWGMRVNDANHNPIFDSLGLIAVMSQPSPSVHGGNPGKIFNNVTVPTVITDGNGVADAITVIALRAGMYLILGTVQVIDNTAGGQSFGCQIYVDGQLPADAGSFTFNGITAGTNVTLIPFYVASVAKGAHTFDVRCVSGAATSYSVTTFDLYVFQIGA